jgi:hypothetical protein
MFFIFLYYARAELTPGDDPYAILGVPRSAIQSEIKAAYKKLTLQYHPDVSKESNAQEKWIRVNEAYDVLSDPDRKARFDKFGKLDKVDSLDEEKDMYYGKPDTKREVKDITFANFESFTKPKGDYMFLVYRTVLCDECDLYLHIFEEYNRRFKKRMHCGVIDATNEIEITAMLGVEKVPSFVFIKKTNGTVENNTTRKAVSTKPISSIKDIVDFWLSQYPAAIADVSSKSKLNSFLNDNPTHVHVVQYVRQGGPTVSYHIIASVLRDYFSFGFYTDASFTAASNYNITMFPEVHIYRNPELPPLRFNEMSQLAKEILQYSNPVLFHVDGFTFARHCQQFCYVRCGKPPFFQAKGLVEINASIGWIEKDSNFVKSLKMDEGEWVAIFPEVGTFLRVQKRLDDKASLKYFFDDYRRKKVKEQPIPADFGFPLTFSAFLTESIRFAKYIIKMYGSAIFFFSIFIFSICLNYYLKKKDNKANEKKGINKKKN